MTLRPLDLGQDRTGTCATLTKRLLVGRGRARGLSGGHCCAVRGWRSERRCSWSPERLDAAPHDAAWQHLAGVAFDGLALQGTVDGHDEVGLGVAVERCAVLLPQPLGNGVGDGPAEDRQVEGVRGAGRDGGRVGVVGVAGDAGDVEPR